jgi:YegS/Rv2252/BmrU family lipid kinase
VLATSDEVAHSSTVAAKPVPRDAVLIVNTHSRRGEALFQEVREKLEQAGIRITAAHAVRDTDKLVPTVIAAVKGGAPMVILGGGDGTLSSAVDEIVGSDCVFALLPLGTANSFARTLGIPLDLDGAIETIANGRRRRIDLGVVNGDYFANAAAMGISPMIGETVPPGLKRYLGRLGYLIWGIRCMARFRPFRLTVNDGDTQHTIWTTEVRIANGRFHGGVELIEDAVPDDGQIVVQAVTGKSVMRLIWDWFGRFFRLPTRDLMTQEFRGSRFELATRPRQKISIDGEVLTKTPATVESAHKAIEVVVPPERWSAA